MNNKTTENAVFIREGVTSKIIPEELKREFETISEVSFHESLNFNKADKKFIYKIIGRYGVNPYFCLRIILKIGLYSRVINTHNPLAIITHIEYSFTSSVLTEYCKINDIEHI